VACFLAPAGEAIVTTIVQKVVEKREKKGVAVQPVLSDLLGAGD